MRNAILFSLLALAVLVTVVSDLRKRFSEGIPDFGASGVSTLAGRAPIEVGVGEADLSAHTISDTSEKSIFDLPELAQFNGLPWPSPSVAWKAGPRKTVNRLSVKVMLLKTRQGTAAIVSADLPRFSPGQVEAVAESLRAAVGTDPRFVFCFSVGLPNYVTVLPQNLGQCAARAARAASGELLTAESGTLTFEKPPLPASDNRVWVPGAGTLDVPPLCGPTINNRLYDATDLANRWLSTLSAGAPLLPPFSVSTAEIKHLRLSVIAFRTKSRRLIGGLILSPYAPCIAPPSELNGEISPDYTDHLCGFLERKLGGHFLLLRSPGSNVIPYIDGFSHSNAHRFGAKIGAAVASEFKSIKWQKPGPLRAYHKPIRLPLKPQAQRSKAELSSDIAKYRRQLEEVREVGLDLEAKRSIQDKFLSATHLFSADSLAVARAGRPALRGFRLNDWFFLSIPGENFPETEEEIRRLSGGARLFVADGLDGPASYVVPSQTFNGVFKPVRSFYARDAAQELVRQALNFLNLVGIAHAIH